MPRARRFGGLRRIPKKKSSAFARRFRRSTYRQTEAYYCSETVFCHANFALCGEHPVVPTKRNLKRTALSASRFRFFRFVKVATTSLLAELYCLRGYFGTAGAADVSEVADPEGAP